MSRNRRKTDNSIELAAIVKWTILAGILGVFGLFCVYLKIEMHQIGSEKNRLERELETLATQNEAIRGQITALTSRVELQRRVNEKFIQLTPIPDTSIVRLQPKRGNEGGGTLPENLESEILPVANDQITN